MDFDTFHAQMPALGFLPFAPRPVAMAARIHAAQPEPEAQCVRCGCTDSRACPQGCSWLACDRAQRLGVCSSCEGHLWPWLRGSNASGGTPGRSAC